MPETEDDVTNTNPSEADAGGDSVKTETSKNGSTGENAQDNSDPTDLESGDDVEKKTDVIVEDVIVKDPKSTSLTDGEIQLEGLASKVASDSINAKVASAERTASVSVPVPVPVPVATVPTTTATEAQPKSGILVEATPVDDVDAVEAHVVVTTIEATQHTRAKKSSGISVVAMVAIVCLVVALSVGLSARKSDGSGAPAIDPKRRKSIRSILAPLSGNEVFDPKSPEFSADRLAALDWLLEQDQKSPLPLDDSSQLWHVRQLYVVSLFYFATNGEEWNKQYRFLQGINECDWTSSTAPNEPCEGEDCEIAEDPADLMGLICNDNGRVRKFHLWWNNLSGTVPHELSYLEDLDALNIGGGAMIGTIPSSLQKLSNLEFMAFSDHCLTGTVPDFSNMPMLTVLSVYNNYELSGSFNAFCNGTDLREGMIAVIGDCGCTEDYESKIDCDCCMCCESSTYRCCDKDSDAEWSNIPPDIITPDGFLAAFQKPCLSEAAQQHIDEVCPCIYDSNPEDELYYYSACTTNCSREDATPSYSMFS